MNFDRTIMRMVNRINEYDRDRHAWWKLMEDIAIDKNSAEFDYFLNAAKEGTKQKFRNDLKQILIEEYEKDE